MGILWRGEIAEEVKKQLWLGGPMVFVCVFQFSLQMISMMFVGHLDELLLASASLGASFVNVTGFNVLLGMSSALDTFCGQSYRAQQYDMVGIHTQRAMLVTLITTIPISIIWAYLKPILILMHQDKFISAEAEQYARFLIPSLSANAILRCLVKFLQTQNIVFPMVLATGLTSLVQVLACWIFVTKLGFAVKGAAIAFVISNWFNTIVLAIYVMFSPACKSTWTGFSKEAFHKMPQYLKLAFPSTVMVGLETWTFELMVLLSGALPNPKLQTSVFSICLSTSGIFWMVPFAVSMAGSTRISNELGAGRPKSAHLAVRVSIFIAFTVGIIESAIIMSVRKTWGHVFTNVDEVVKYVTSMMPILASNAFVDSVQTAFQGIARGCGWQKLGAYVNLGSYYLLGFPFSIVLAFVFHMKGKGLFLGILLALSVQVVCFLLVTLNTNWEKEAQKAATRVKSNGAQVDAVPDEENVTV